MAQIFVLNSSHYAANYFPLNNTFIQSTQGEKKNSYRA